MNLLELRKRTLRLVGENVDQPEIISNDLVDDALNEAYRDFSTLSGALEVREGLSATADVAEYDLSDRVSRPFRVAFDGYQLTPTSQRELDDLDPEHRTITGTPTAWTKDRLDERRLRFYPIPDTGGAGGSLDADLGTELRITGDDTFLFNNEVGTIIRIASEDTAYTFTSELGIVIGIEVKTNDFEVWAKKTPRLLEADDDEPELPEYAHLGLAYSAAARVLTARNELRNESLGALYEAQAQDYLRHLTRIASNRQPERVQRHSETGRVRSFRHWQPIEIPEP